MRTAISFYQLPAEEPALFEFLNSTGGILARRHQSLPIAQPIELLPLSQALTKDGGVFVLCRQGDVPSLLMPRYKAQGQWWHGVDVDASPVLTYACEPLTPLAELSTPTLFRSSLGASLDYVDLRTGQRRQKQLDFKRWAKAAVTWMREHCTEKCTLHGFDYPATRAVVAAWETGKITLGS